jgi:hypothetical protein
VDSNLRFPIHTHPEDVLAAALHRLPALIDERTGSPGVGKGIVEELVHQLGEQAGQDPELYAQRVLGTISLINNVPREGATQ